MTEPKKTTLPNFAALVELMDRLREPPGCPWDQAQTPETLTPYIIEEAHELVDAIRENDPAHVREELGDLLFQIVFQARIFAERGRFTIADVVAGIHEKMVRRHPHVFGDGKADTAEQVRANWVRLKEAEGKVRIESALGRVSDSMPGLLRGRRLTENAATVGFDWPNAGEVMAKAEEEWGELKASIAAGEPARVEDEFGDLLFALVNLSRFLNVDPEQALRGSIAKFVRRFRYLEEKLTAAGKRLEDCSLAEMDALWNEAKGKGM
jgi:tetrapyrrole methylase family protein/MazG family protein